MVDLWGIGMSYNDLQGVINLADSKIENLNLQGERVESSNCCEEKLVCVRANSNNLPIDTSVQIFSSGVNLLDLSKFVAGGYIEKQDDDAFVFRNIYSMPKPSLLIRAGTRIYFKTTVTFTKNQNFILVFNQEDGTPLYSISTTGKTGETKYIDRNFVFPKDVYSFAFGGTEGLGVGTVMTRPIVSFEDVPYQPCVTDTKECNIGDTVYVQQFYPKTLVRSDSFDVVLDCEFKVRKDGDKMV